VSQLAKKGIMTSFTKTEFALIDSDNGNCLLAEASITTEGLYVITKVVRRASPTARSLSATAASSPSKGLAPLFKDIQMLWHARLGCFREQGIKFTSSSPYSPESNGLAENFNKALFARVHCLLDHSGMDKVMWGEAFLHAVHLLNITPSRSLGNITPNEAAYGVVPDVSKLRVFGCVAFATLPYPKKLDDKEVRATNLGSHWLRKVSSAAAGTRLQDIRRDLCEI
jgi:hypothetical protein